jgi:Ca2+-binding EF-hand superfamily protein
MGNKQHVLLQTILDDTQNDKNMQAVFKKYDKDHNGFIDKVNHPFELIL